MASDLLTDRSIKAALRRARERGRPVIANDGDGLRLEAQPTGAGWWRWRNRFGGKEQRLSVGTYPEVSLADARQRRTEARKLLAAGGDPSAARKAEKAAVVRAAELSALEDAGEALPGTFEALAREWLAEVHEAKVSVGHAVRSRVRFEQDAFPYVGRRPLAELEAPELLTVLRRVTARGAIETAHRLKDACGQVFRYGIAIGLCQRNPAADLRDALPPVPSRHHAAITDPKLAGELLRNMA